MGWGGAAEIRLGNKPAQLGRQQMVARFRGDSLTKLLRKCTPLVFKRGYRMLQARVQTLSAKYHCPVCSSRVDTFERLPEFYFENQQKYGFPSDGVGEWRSHSTNNSAPEPFWIRIVFGV